MTTENPFVSYTVGPTPEDTFVIPFQFWQNEDLTVRFGPTLEEGVPIVGWNTTGAGDPAGGSLTLSDPVSDGVLSIQRYVSEDRYTIFPIAGPFRIEALNTEFDRVIAMISDRRFVADVDQVVWDDIVGKPDVVVWDDLYPVGSVHLTFVNAPPPRGTWQLITGGTFLIGAGGAYPVDSQGGAVTDSISLIGNNIPPHTHPFSGTGSTSTDGSHTHSYVDRGMYDSGDDAGGFKWKRKDENKTTGSAGNHSHTVTISGDTDVNDTAQTPVVVDTVPPYIACYMWRRTA